MLIFNSIDEDKLLMSTGVVPTGGQSTRLGGCKPQQTHHATYSACQFEHRRLRLFGTYEDLSYK